MERTARFRDAGWILLILALAIAAVGIAEIYSTTAHSALAGQAHKQIYWVLLGAALAIIASRFDYHILLEQTPWIYSVTVVALALLLVVGPRIAGTKRWFVVGGLTFQVSEFAKLAIILAVAAYFADRAGKAVTWKDFAKVGAIVGLPAVLVTVEPDLGTALTFMPIGAAGLFLAGIRPKQIAALVLVGALMLPVGWHFLKPYQRDRLTSFIHPSHDTQGASYQGTQSKIAIGAGGFWGKGFGNGTQSRLGFVPVSHADFVFAAFAEEQGFIGTLVVLLLYLALLLRLLDSAQTAGDRGGKFLCAGIATVIFFQVVINAGMMIGLFPIAGIPLPLMSQGGSATLGTFLALGLAMSVNMRRFVN
ncbi:MAG: rod shape-determining protein RodA [Acidobacteria bacterium]|nr:rod shape-determining protein RodA [Acidobacteriota bacterium]